MSCGLNILPKLRSDLLISSFLVFWNETCWNVRTTTHGSRAQFACTVVVSSPSVHNSHPSPFPVPWERCDTELPTSRQGLPANSELLLRNLLKCSMFEFYWALEGHTRSPLQLVEEEGDVVRGFSFNISLRVQRTRWLAYYCQVARVILCRFRILQKTILVIQVERLL